MSSAALLERIRQTLVRLKMPFALEQFSTVAGALENGSLTALEVLDTRLAEELSHRESRRVKVSIATAGLMPPKPLESHGFAFQPSLDPQRIAALATLDFIERCQTVHFLSPPGAADHR